MMELDYSHSHRDHENLQPPPAHMSPASSKPRCTSPGPPSILPLGLLNHAMNAGPFIHSSLLNNNNMNMVVKMSKPLSYSSPPPMPSNPENNICKMIDYRNAKVAAFLVDGTELICLPQAFELFLKDLVGGLHTVYTKLKRLDIQPVVCNVEQVRILRGLGAIQPGVNRCKLLSCKDFDVLYDDCTNSSARPGRPPKRNSPAQASPDTLEKLKKSRLENADFLFDTRHYMDNRKATPLINGFTPHPYTMGALPFMPFAHHMMSPPLSMAAHLSMRGDGALIKDRSVHDLISPRTHEEKLEQLRRANERAYEIDKDMRQQHESQTDLKPLNLNMNGHLDLSMKKSNIDREDKQDDHLGDDDDLDSNLESNDERDDDLDDEELNLSDSGGQPEVTDKISTQGCYDTTSQSEEQQRYNSIETLLLQIQGLVKVAAENTRNHERQVNIEKSELKMDLLKEKEIREKIEQKLRELQKTQNLLIKKLRHEKQARRSLQDQMECDQKRSTPGNISNGEESPKSQSPREPSHYSENNNTSQDMTNSTNQNSTDRVRTEIEQRSINDSSLERGSHNIYDGSWQTRSTSPVVNRFPYLPLVKSDA